jgi:hypothetical protein
VIVDAAVVSEAIKEPCTLEPGLMMIEGRLEVITAVDAGRGLTRVKLPPVPCTFRVPANVVEVNTTSFMPTITAVVTPADGPSAQWNRKIGQAIITKEWGGIRHETH